MNIVEISHKQSKHSMANFFPNLVSTALTDMNLNRFLQIHVIYKNGIIISLSS